MKQIIHRVDNIICTAKKFAIILDHSQLSLNERPQTSQTTKNVRFLLAGLFCITKVTKIIHCSLEHGVFSYWWKCPGFLLHKKSGLERTFINYRPFSNLQFISCNLTGSAAAKQLWHNTVTWIIYSPYYKYHKNCFATETYTLFLLQEGCFSRKYSMTCIILKL